MFSNRCCFNGTITGDTISADPTATDTNYPIGFIGWTPANKAFLHTGSGNWIALGASSTTPPPENGIKKQAKHVGK